MTKFAANIYVDGTAARKMYTRSRTHATVVSFPERRAKSQSRTGRTHTPSHGVIDSLKSILRRSEMACSLMLETCAGCAYGLFSHRQVLLFAIALTTILACAIAIGA